MERVEVLYICIISDVFFEILKFVRDIVFEYFSIFFCKIWSSIWSLIKDIYQNNWIKCIYTSWPECHLWIKSGTHIISEILNFLILIYWYTWFWRPHIDGQFIFHIDIGCPKCLEPKGCPQKNLKYVFRCVSISTVGCVRGSGLFGYLNTQLLSTIQRFHKKIKHLTMNQIYWILMIQNTEHFMKKQKSSLL